jgi:hypothetical protein
MSGWGWFPFAGALVGSGAAHCDRLQRQAPMNGTVDTLGGDTQLDLALRRIQEEACQIDPQAAVARFTSAW